VKSGFAGNDRDVVRGGGEGLDGMTPAVLFTFVFVEYLNRLHYSAQEPVSAL